MPKCRGFKMASLNITSLLKHIDELRVFLNDQNVDVLAINETRLNQSIFDQEVKVQGRVVRKPINANPGLKVNRGNDFSYIKVLSIAYILCRLRLLMLKTEGQKI